MSDLANGGGVALPLDLLTDIASTPVETPAPPAPAPVLASAGPLPGGVSAMPIDAATFLQVTIPPNPSYVLPGGSASVTITARILQPDGTLTYCRWDQTFAVAAGLSFASDLAPGYLLSVAVTCNTAAVVDGALYAVVGLTHQNTPGIPLDTLLVSSYISSFAPTGWPNGILRTISDGNGFTLVATVAAPGAGNPAVYTIVDEYFELLGVQCAFATGVAVANRQFQVYVQPSPSTLEIVTVCPNVQAAGLGINYYVGVGLDLEGAVGTTPQVMPLVERIFLPVGSTVTIFPSGMQVTDTISAARFFGRAWL